MASKSLLSSKAKASTTGSLFDQRQSKQKFSILNKTVIGVKGNASKSKKRSLEMRKKALIPAMQRRQHSGNIVDRRFGVRSRDLDEDAKILGRFSRERSKRQIQQDSLDVDSNSTSMLTLTHGGRPITEDDGMDSDPDLNEFESDEEGGYLDQELDGQNKDLTHAEIMAQVMAKSKHHKMERQRIKAENEQLCADLDADFAAISGSLVKRSVDEVDDKAFGDDFNSSIHKMSFDRRAAPSDRTKTKQELEKIELDKLAAFDADTKKAMSLDDFDFQQENDDEDSDDADQVIGKNGIVNLGLQHVESKAGILLDQFCLCEDESTANAAYQPLLELARTNSIIPLSRAIRDRMGQLSRRREQQLKKCEQSKRPLLLAMPEMDELMLYHFISIVFRCSDAHHVVVTPALLMMEDLLMRARISSVDDLLRGLFVAQTMLKMLGEASRWSSALVGFMSLVRHYLFKEPASLLFDDCRAGIKRSVFEESALVSVADIKAKQLTINDLTRPSKASELAAAAWMDLSLRIKAMYKDNLAFAEMCSCVALASDNHMMETSKRRRKPMMLQKFKAVAIQELMPDLDFNDGQSREEKASARLKKTYKRELKGARRELKRDAAFIASHKLLKKLADDKAYKERHNKLMGSISNEASISSSASSKR